MSIEVLLKRKSNGFLNIEKTGILFVNNIGYKSIDQGNYD